MRFLETLHVDQRAGPKAVNLRIETAGEVAALPLQLLAGAGGLAEFACQGSGQMRWIAQVIAETGGNGQDRAAVGGALPDGMLALAAFGEHRIDPVVGDGQAGRSV
jgi:hypothetical protein